MTTSTRPTRPALEATQREITGKRVARLRRDGQLPAVVYGRGVPSTNLSVNAHAFDLLRRHAGPNALIDLSIDGQKPDPVLVHDVQVHPLSRRPIHVDLFLVRMTEEMVVDVRLVALGIAPAADRDGGTVLHPTETVRVRALPDHLPQAIEYSVESLEDFDMAIHVRDLVIPEDVTLLTDLDEVIAKVLPPRVEVEEAPVVEGEEGEEGEEGAAAEAGAEGAAAEAGGGDEAGSSEG